MSSLLNWVALLQPDLVLADSVSKITPDLLAQYRLKGLILDVDDTLVSTTATDASPETILWLTEIRQIASISLVSNNFKRSRIERIANSLDVPYIFGAGKPSRRKLRQAVTVMGLPLEEVAMVGDRLFTDVLAGNRLGLFTILVEPLGRGTFLRGLELFLFKILKRLMTLFSRI
ncbi:MAG: YqeG family HAD IIIA-type phosphatase [Acaryochloridaceae cyanobacterium SU_2_1]|nr:YqeG family HAD IIIA-type phosphatase [Acaryochloridaceae cyanobacterium SU_2_1]